MEAEGGYKHTTLRTVTWRGDWELFKEEFGAAVNISGTSNAIELAERLAKGEEMDALEDLDKHLVRTGLSESRRLKTQLTLSLITCNSRTLLHICLRLWGWQPKANKSQTAVRPYPYAFRNTRNGSPKETNRTRFVR